MKRLTELDILRGVLLLMMVVNHSPSSLRRFTDQPVGFFTTAEAFVFVSAFLAGMLFRKRMEKDGFDAARSSTIHRAVRIYCAHLLTLAFAFTIGGFLLIYDLFSSTLVLCQLLTAFLLGCFLESITQSKRLWVTATASVPSAARQRRNPSVVGCTGMLSCDSVR
jgi:peptidoglycan/LPS O-acetylase OafA/YrhL